MMSHEDSEVANMFEDRTGSTSTETQLALAHATEVQAQHIHHRGSDSRLLTPAHVVRSGAGPEAKLWATHQLSSSNLLAMVSIVLINSNKVLFPQISPYPSCVKSIFSAEGIGAVDCVMNARIVVSKTPPTELAECKNMHVLECGHQSGGLLAILIFLHAASGRGQQYAYRVIFFSHRTVLTFHRPQNFFRPRILPSFRTSSDLLPVSKR